MAYLKPLDGIRAIAIIAVLLFHISPAALRGGFAGVDVFFVLSGFLITSIILNDLREGCFSIREFYLRRIQRLLPNVIVTVLAVLVLWTSLMPPSVAHATGRHALWTLFNASNFYIWLNLGAYWGGSAEWAPLTHTWSLGVEEQFYLLFPTLLLLLVRFQPNRLKLWLSVATALSFGSCLYGSYVKPVPTFYLLHTRVWELLLGAIIAAHRTPFPGNGDDVLCSLQPKGRMKLGWMGLIMIGASFFAIGEKQAFPGWVCLLPTVGTVMLLLSVVEGETAVSRFLSSRFMVRTGKLSYSLYLWHWPLITFGKIQADLHGLPTFTGALAGGGVGILLGWLAYVCIEQPLRNRGQGRPWKLAIIAAGFIVAVLFSRHVAFRHREAGPFHLFNTPTSSMNLFEVGRERDYHEWLSTVALFDVKTFTPSPQPVDPWKTGGIVHLYGGGQPRVVVLGSSHALMYARLIDDICRDAGVSVAFLASAYNSTIFFETAMSPSFPSEQLAHEYDEARRKYLHEWHPAVVIAIDGWDLRATSADAFERKFRPFLREVAPLAGRVLFVAEVPTHTLGNEVNLREVATTSVVEGKGLPRFMPNSNDQLRREIATRAESLTTEFANLKILRTDRPFYNVDGSIRYTAGKDFLYIDGSHLSDAGTEVVHDLFQQAITDAIPSATSQ